MSIKKCLVKQAKIKLFYNLIWIKQLNKNWALLLNNTYIKDILKEIDMPLFFKNKRILHKLFFWRTLQVFHWKTFFLKNFKLFHFFTKKLFPFWKRKKFVRKLLWIRKLFFVKKKLEHFKYSYTKSNFWKKKKLRRLRTYYYLSRIVYLPALSLSNMNLKKIKFFFKQDLLFYNVSKKFYKKKIKWLTKIFLWDSTWVKKNKIMLKRKFSKLLSFWIRKVYSNLNFYKKIKKIKKNFFYFSLKRLSFYHIYRFEYFVSFKNFFFKHCIKKNISNSYYFPATRTYKSFIFKNLIKFWRTIYNESWTLNIKKKLLKTVFITCRFNSKNNLGCFNMSFFEKIIRPLFFLKNETKITKYDYVQTLLSDEFFSKKSFLPFFLKKKLELINVKIKKFSLYYSTVEDCLLSYLTLRVYDSLLHVLFGTSTLGYRSIISKFWTSQGVLNMASINYTWLNWDYLSFFPKKQIKEKSKKKFCIKNIYLFLDFSFFLNKRKILFENIKEKKPNVWEWVNLGVSIHKILTPLNLLYVNAEWRFFFKRRFFNKKRIAIQVWEQKRKATYDFYIHLTGWFWPKFFWKWSAYDKLLSYGKFFRRGYKEFNVKWNFHITMWGYYNFKIMRWVALGLGWKMSWLYSSKTKPFEYLKHSYLFTTFLSFLTRSYLLYNLLHFGHTKNTLNTSYKDFILLIYNDKFIINLVQVQVSLKRNLQLLFKMFYLGGLVCVVSPFNILTEGLISLYGSYGGQPYTRYKWVNGLFSNYNKILNSIKKNFLDIYSGKSILTHWKVWKLIKLWFCLKGIFFCWSMDINFFPSLRRSSWVFFETNSKFYPTSSIANTSAFMSTPFLDYFSVANDYSLLAISFYLNLLITMCKKVIMLRKLEFSVYPQKLLTKIKPYSIIPNKASIRLAEIDWHLYTITNILRNSQFLFFERWVGSLIRLFNNLFHCWKASLLEHKKHVLWWYFYYYWILNITKMNP